MSPLPQVLHAFNRRWSNNLALRDADTKSMQKMLQGLTDISQYCVRRLISRAILMCPFPVWAPCLHRLRVAMATLPLTLQTIKDKEYYYIFALNAMVKSTLLSRIISKIESYNVYINTWLTATIFSWPLISSHSLRSSISLLLPSKFHYSPAWDIVPPHHASSDFCNSHFICNISMNESR